MVQNGSFLPRAGARVHIIGIIYYQHVRPFVLCLEKKNRVFVFCFGHTADLKLYGSHFAMTFSPELQVIVKSKQSKGPVTASVGGSLVNYMQCLNSCVHVAFGVTSGSDQNRK